MTYYCKKCKSFSTAILPLHFCPKCGDAVENVRAIRVDDSDIHKDGGKDYDKLDRM